MGICCGKLMPGNAPPPAAYGTHDHVGATKVVTTTDIVPIVTTEIAQMGIEVLSKFLDLLKILIH